MGHAKDGRLKCDGWCGDSSAPQDCPSKVTHIDEKGYAYCTPCGIQRKAPPMPQADRRGDQATASGADHQLREAPQGRVLPLPGEAPRVRRRLLRHVPAGAILTWAWGENRFSDGYSLGAVAEAIAESVVQDLDNGKAGTVTGPDGVEYQINVCGDADAGPGGREDGLNKRRREPSNMLKG